MSHVFNTASCQIIYLIHFHWRRVRVIGTIADGAPVIPISAQLKYNIDVVCEYIVKKIPVPIRDFLSEPRLIGMWSLFLHHFLSDIWFVSMCCSLNVTMRIFSKVVLTNMYRHIYLMQSQPWVPVHKIVTITVVFVIITFTLLSFTNQLQSHNFDFICIMHSGI